MFAQLALLTLLAVPVSPRLLAVPSYRPKVEVWTNRGNDPYAAGEAVRVSFQTDQDAYVTVLRVDTDGRVRILFPRAPWEENFARGGIVYEVQSNASPAGFRADIYPGQGYLFAVAAADPFMYDPIENAQRWNYELIADGGRIRGDPYAALTELAERFVAPGSSDWDYDIAPYYVGQHYEYPRFLCYDCHAYVNFRSWNPYDYSCVRFRMVVFDDPYYYPYRSYGGTRVVFRRPFRPEPRFIFKDRRGSDPFVTRVRERPVNDNRRRDVGVRGRDIGGAGTVPPPHPVGPRERPGLPGQRGDVYRGAPRDRRDDPVYRPARPDPRDDRGSFARPDRTRRPDYPVRPTRPDRATPSDPRDRGRFARPDRTRGPDYPARPIRPDRATPPDRPNRGADRGQWDRGRSSPSASQRRPESGRARGSAESGRPRQSPRAEPSRGGQRDHGRRGEPELRRRKP